MTQEEKPKKRRGKKQTKVAEAKRDKRFGGRITEDLYERLVEVAEIDQRSVSAEIQIALSEWVTQREKQLGKFVALAS